MLLVVGSGHRLYREYILRSAASRYRLWLLDFRETTWQRPYVSGVTRLDTSDPVALRAAARAVTARLPVAGVFTYDESQVIACARLAEDLGLPGSPPETIRICRDKAATRAALSAAGVPQPLSRPVDSAEQARAAADAIGYPVVVKARGLAGSFGVVRADDGDAVATAYAAADRAVFTGMRRYETGNVLVEEFLTGQEISVDAVVFDGEVTPTVLARKHVGLDPFFEETGHDVDAADPLLSDVDLLGQLRQIHRALGFRHGTTHTELKLTPAGPRLVEINARLGGDLIPYLGKLATGIDLGVAAAQVAAGVRPDTAARHRKAASVRFLYPPGACEVVEVVVHPDRFGPTIYETGVIAIPGDRLDLPPRAYMSRYGYAVGVGDSTAQVADDLESAEKIVELVARPI